MGKKANTLAAVALEMQRSLHLPVIRYDGTWWGGMIYQSTRMLRYIVPLLGHGCRNGRRGDADYYIAVDIAMTDSQYMAYEVANKKVVPINEFSSYSQGLALRVYPAPKGGIARTEFGPFPSGNSFNLSYVDTLTSA